MTEISINKFPTRYQPQLSARNIDEDSSGSINSESEARKALGILLPEAPINDDLFEPLQVLVDSSSFENTRQLFMSINDELRDTYQQRQLFRHLLAAYQLLEQGGYDKGILLEIANQAGKWCLAVYNFMEKTLNFAHQQGLGSRLNEVLMSMAEIASSAGVDSNFAFSKYYDAYRALQCLTDDPLPLLVSASRSAEGATGTAYMAVTKTIPELDGLLISRAKQLELIEIYFHYGEGFPDSLTTIVDAYRFLCLEYPEYQALAMINNWLRTSRGYSYIMFENLLRSFQISKNIFTKNNISRLLDLVALESSKNQRYSHLYLADSLQNIQEIFQTTTQQELLDNYEKLCSYSTKNCGAVLYRLADIDSILKGFGLSVRQLYYAEDIQQQKLLADIMSIDPERFYDECYLKVLQTRISYELGFELPQKVLLAVFGTNDRTGVFQIDKIKQMFSDYYDNGYQILYFEKSFDHQYIDLLKELLTKNIVFSDKIIAGHGDQQILALGGDNPIDGIKRSEEYFIDLESDLEKFDGLDLSALLREDGKILCISCKTGSGKEEADNIANFLSSIFQRRVLAPVMPTNVEEVVFDEEQNFLTIKWTMGIENYQAGNY